MKITKYSRRAIKQLMLLTLLLILNGRCFAQGFVGFASYEANFRFIQPTHECSSFYGVDTGNWGVSHGSPFLFTADGSDRAILLGFRDGSTLSTNDFPKGEGLFLNFEFKAGNRYKITFEGVSLAPRGFGLEADAGALLEVFAANGVASAIATDCDDIVESPTVSDRILLNTISTAANRTERREIVIDQWVPDQDYEQLWLRARVPFVGDIGTVVFQAVAIEEEIAGTGGGNTGGGDGNDDLCDLYEPTGLAAYRTSDSHVLLAWDEVPGAYSYDVNFVDLQTGRASTFRFVETNQYKLFLMSGDFIYNIVANCINGERSNFSDNFEFNTVDLEAMPEEQECMTLSEILRLEKNLPTVELADASLRYEGPPLMQEEYPGQYYPTVLEAHVYELVLFVKEQIRLMPGVRFTATRDESFILRVTPCLTSEDVEAVRSGSNRSNDYSIPRTANFSSLLGIPEAQTERLNIYPNPITDIAIVEHPKFDQGVQIEILANSGNVLNTVRGSGTSTRIDFSAFPSGMYMIKIKGEEGFYEHKKVLKH